MCSPFACVYPVALGCSAVLGTSESLAEALEMLCRRFSQRTQWGVSTIEVGSGVRAFGPNVDSQERT